MGMICLHKLPCYLAHFAVTHRRAIERGDLPADTNTVWFLDSISGVIYYRLIMSGDDPDEPPRAGGQPSCADVGPVDVGASPLRRSPPVSSPL